jgi:hypothetical protein
LSITTCPVPKCGTKDVDGNPVLINTPVCDRCAAKVRTVLVTAESIHRDAGQALAPAASGADSERVSTGETIRLPINGEALALQQDIVRVLAYAAEDLLELATVPRLAGEHLRLSLAATALLERLDEALALPGFAADVVDLGRRANRLLGTTAPPVKLHAPCSVCGCLALTREAGTEDVECRACGSLYDPHAYNHLVTETLKAAA